MGDLVPDPLHDQRIHLEKETKMLSQCASKLVNLLASPPQSLGSQTILMQP